MKRIKLIPLFLACMGLSTNVVYAKSDVKAAGKGCLSCHKGIEDIRDQKSGHDGYYQFTRYSSW